MLPFRILSSLVRSNFILKSNCQFNISSLRSFYSTGVADAPYQYILADKVGIEKNVGLITLNRPKAWNVLCDALISELAAAVGQLDKDESVGAIVITGNEKAFAAGADIKEMANNTYSENVKDGVLPDLDGVSECKKPIIAAVNGYALGGGCDLAMMCDIIYAGEKVKFGYTELLIGSIPGAGGTQRIARSCGKSFAMEVCLTGNHFSAQEALARGLISKVYPADELVEEAIKLGERISQYSRIIVQICKESVNNAFETNLNQGLKLERRQVYATFAHNDRKKRNDRVCGKKATEFFP